MGEVQLVALLLEQVGEPLPAVGRLERDLQLTAELGQDRLQRLRLVRDPAREQLLTLLVEGGDLRALAVEIDANVDHLFLGLLPGLDFDDALGISPPAWERQEARFFMASSAVERLE